MNPEVSLSIQKICEQDSQFAATYERYRWAMQTWEATGILTVSDIVGKRILDWECGRGVFSAIFSELGAASVVGIDSWLDTTYVCATLADLPGVRFERISLEEFATDEKDHGAFDLVFANTVTEHMLNLPYLLSRCYRLLASGGIFISNHDNYYQPVGSHDHGFLGYRDNRVVFLGPRCWDTEAKCAASVDFRQSVAQRFPWTWDAQTESQLTPEDCSRCPYYRRAQPWAHLLYQREFRKVFPQPSFTTGYPRSSLNKITPFQLRQFLIEAGFDIERWVPHRIATDPPAELLKPPFSFSVDDLCTSVIAMRCRKGELPKYD